MSKVTPRVAGMAIATAARMYPEIAAGAYDGLLGVDCNEEGCWWHCRPGSAAERHIRGLLSVDRKVVFDIDGITWRLPLRIETRSVKRGV